MMTTYFSAVLIVLGIAILVRTVVAGIGGGLGLILGVLFVLAGGLRLYLQRIRN